MHRTQGTEGQTLTSPRSPTIRAVFTLGLMLAAAGFSGCSSEDSDEPVGTINAPLTEEDLPESITRSWGTDLGKWTAVGPINKERTTGEGPELKGDIRALADQPPEFGSPVLGVQSRGDGMRYRWEVDADELKTRVAELTGGADIIRGHEGEPGTTPTPLPESLEDAVEKGWSDGFDDRSKRDIATWGQNHITYAKIGRVDAALGCTGTFVGSAEEGYFMLTAAHCMFDSSGDLVWGTFTPRMDGDVSDNTVLTPFGTWDITWAVYYDGYLDNDCFDDYDFAVCAKYDIILTEVVPGGSYPGSLAFVRAPDEDIEQLSTRYHRGYPGCGVAGAPASSCEDQTLYGDGSNDVGSWAAPLSGWYRTFLHSSDTSLGQSGGPHYTDQVYVYGVEVGESCVGSACTASLVNVARHIDTHWYDVMAFWTGD